MKTIPTLLLAIMPSVSSLVPPLDPKSLDTIKTYDNAVQTTYGRYPLVIESGHGCWLKTSDKEYLDAVAGIATCSLGHANEYLNAAITSQMESVHHVSNLYYIPQQAALAQFLVDNSIAQKVFFCNSGAEANEAAIKLARLYANKRGVKQPVIISAKDSFHGRTLAALSATGQTKYHQGFEYNGEMVPGFRYVEYNNVQDLERVVHEITNDPQLGLAGIIMEALQGEGGIKPGSLPFFQKIRDLCDTHDALMICDEVQIGMGRSGKLWGYENLPNIQPDVITSAKALGGGVPIGAMLAGPKAADTFQPGNHASTYGGNPLACAAGVAVAKFMCENNVLANCQARGVQLTQGLETLREKFPELLGEIRGWGLLQGVVVKDITTPGVIVQAAMDQGLLVLGAGANVLRFVPPLIITETEMDMLLERLGAAVAQVYEEQVAAAAAVVN